MKVAVFRPADDRLERAVSLLASLGVEPVADPMLAVEPTGAAPRTDADVTAFTSKTGVERASAAEWEPGTGTDADGGATGGDDRGRGTTVAAIGGATADALREHGYPVDVVPSEFSSSGLVAALAGSVDGARVEVARSDHGSDVLLDGLAEAGAYVHETVLYRLVRPDDAGDSTDLAARGDLAGALFTSSLTVAHFLAAADDRGHRSEAIGGLNRAVVGCIGEPTRETAAGEGIDVDVVPAEADFGALARAVVDRLAR